MSRLSPGALLTLRDYSLDTVGPNLEVCVQISTLLRCSPEVVVGTGVT